jgi:hypothetical protein
VWEWATYHPYLFTLLFIVVIFAWCELMTRGRGDDD